MTWALWISLPQVSSCGSFPSSAFSIKSENCSQFSTQMCNLFLGLDVIFSGDIHSTSWRCSSLPPDKSFSVGERKNMAKSKQKSYSKLVHDRFPDARNWDDARRQGWPLFLALHKEQIGCHSYSSWLTRGNEECFRGFSAPHKVWSVKSTCCALGEHRRRR